MRKFFLALFVLTLITLGIVVAAVPLFTKVLGPQYLLNVDPPSGAPFGDRDFPIPEKSTVAVQLELPVKLLGDLASRNAPRELKGVQRKNLHEKMTDGVVNWRMWPGPVKVNNSGKDLTFFLPVAGDAHCTGKFGRLKINVKGNANVEGVLSGRMQPYISSDWQVVPQIKTLVRIRKANVTFGRSGNIEAKDKIQEAISPIVETEAKKIGPALTKTLKLREGIQKLWNQAHVVREVANEPQTWVVFDPGLAEMGPINYSNPETVSLTVGMVAQSFITNKQPLNRQPENLPPLTPIPSNPKTEIRVPVIADLKNLNDTLAHKTFNIKPPIGPTITISKAAIELANDPGFLNIRMNVRTASDSGKAYGLSGHFWVKAKPIVDCRTQVLGFTDVSLTVETREAVSGTAAWLMEELVVKTIEAEMRFDLKEYLPKLEDEIHKTINSVPVPEQFELSVSKPEVELLGVYTVNRVAWNQDESPGIVAVLGASSDIKVSFRKL